MCEESVQGEEAGGSALHQSISIHESGISHVSIYVHLYTHVCSLLMGHIGRYGGSGTIGLDFLWIFINQLLHLPCRKRRNNPFSPLLHRAIE